MKTAKKLELKNHLFQNFCQQLGTNKKSSCSKIGKIQVQVQIFILSQIISKYTGHSLKIREHTFLLFVSHHCDKALSFICNFIWEISDIYTLSCPSKSNSKQSELTCYWGLKLTLC